MPDGPGATDPGAALYRVVYDALRREVAEGVLPAGASLPSEGELARRFGVSRITIRHALQLLADEGRIRKAKARRAVVAEPAPGPGGWLLRSLDDLATSAADATLRVDAWRPERAPAEAALFGLDPAARLPCLRGVLLRAGRPQARVAVHFAPDIGARLRREAFDDPVVFRVMQREVGLSLSHVDVTVTAARALAADAAALGVAPGAPMLVLQLRYHAADGRLVEVACTRGAAEALRFATRLDALPPARDP